MDLSNLVQKIQEERAAVALNIFLKRGPSDDLQDLQKMVTTNIDIREEEETDGTGRDREVPDLQRLTRL